MVQHTTVCHVDNGQLNQNWRNQISLSDKYKKYHEPFFNMLFEFKSMWDGHFGTITTTRHSIKLVEPTTAPAHTAL